jgi:hypothetical protein
MAINSILGKGTQLVPLAEGFKRPALSLVICTPIALEESANGVCPFPPFRSESIKAYASHASFPDPDSRDSRLVGI